MKKVVILLTLLTFISGCSKDPVDNSLLVLRDGVMCEQNKLDPYTGKVVGFREDGTKRLEGAYKEGKKDGIWIYWFTDGVNIETKVAFKEGKEDGLYIRYSPDGQKREEQNFKNGLRDGLLTQYYDNTHKEFEQLFKDGKQTGLVTRWYPNGQKESGGFLIDGVKNGAWVYWEENGHKKSEITYRDGKSY